VRAIQVTYPGKNDVVDVSEGVKVTWETVSTDPTSGHIFLVNMAGGGEPYSKDLGKVDLTKGSITISESDVPAGEGYQFNIQSVEKQNTGILAQSEQFEIEEAEKEAETTSTTTAAPTTSASVSASATETDASSTSESSAASSSAATTLSTVTPSSTADVSASGTAEPTGVPTGAANKAVQGGSLLALAIGIMAVVA